MVCDCVTDSHAIEFDFETVLLLIAEILEVELVSLGSRRIILGEIT